MRSTTLLAVAVLVALLVLSATSSQEKTQRPDVAPENREPGGSAKVGKMTAYNVWTGDARIRLRRFHAILFLAAKDADELSDAGKTGDRIGDLLQSFSKDYVERAGKALDFFKEAGFRATPQPKPLIGDTATWPNLKKLVHDRDIRPEDVLFVWMQTHGQQKGTAATLFDSASTPIDRKELRSLLKTRAGASPWLTVFITDRCSVSMTGAGPAGDDGGASADRTIWRSLYFGHKGFVDIDSSTDGEVALIDGTSGSLFVRAFRQVLDEKIVPYEEINKNMDPIIRWDDEFLVALRKHTGKLFDDAAKQGRAHNPGFLAGQRTQTPRIDFSDVRINDRLVGPLPTSKPKQEVAR
jgi:hypothetical protein